MNQSVKLYILGKVQRDQAANELIIVGEHNGSRALERVPLSTQQFAEIDAQVANVRSFVEFGSPAMAAKDIEDLGAKLGDLTLVLTIKSLVDGAAAAAEIMPLEILVEDPALSTWPWEYLYDRVTKVFLCEEFQPVCRCVFTNVRNRLSAEIPPKLRILLLIGADDQTSGLTPGNETKWITEVFQSALDNDLVSIEVVRVFDPTSFQKALVSNAHDVLHYYGHGDFDEARQEAYLALEQRGGKINPFYAQELARTVMNRQTRLVFLNACNTGKGSASAALVRSGLAPALLNKGVPAVVATQFVLPDVSAHRFSSMIYNSLAAGNRLFEAVREGRQTMRNGGDTGFVDWGIPVLYARDSALMLRDPRQQLDKRRGVRMELKTTTTGPLGVAPAKGKPSAVVERTIDQLQPDKRRRVALIDLDSKVGFLPDLAEKANSVQDYYHFAVAYLPFPSGAVRHDLDDEETPQLYLPRVEGALKDATKLLRVNMACCLTRNYLASEEFSNHLAAQVVKKSKVVIVSTAPLPELAAAAGVSFAKAVLGVALSQMIIAEGRWPKLGYHPETHGCLFDYCELHEDMVVALKKMKFDHVACRSQIADPKQLAAIDALLKIDLVEHVADSTQ